MPVDRCKNCEAPMEYLTMDCTYDDIAEYASFSCSVCGWEWEEVSPIHWDADDDNELLAVGLM